LCRETEQARRWLVANERHLTEPLLAAISHRHSSCEESGG
jgi:hypothetical protein